MKKAFKFLMVIFLLTSCLVIGRGNNVYSMIVTKDSDKLLGDFIASAYNIFYGRDVDYDGFSYWYKMIGSGQVSVETFIDKFILESKEFKDTVELKEDFVERMYNFIFDREPDKNGKEYWMSYINKRIVELYKDEYPEYYTNSDILILRWNINNSPKVVKEFVYRLIHSDEFSMRVSFMNAKLTHDSVMIHLDRTSPRTIFDSIKNNIYDKDYSGVIEAEKAAAKKYQNELNNRSVSSQLKSKILKYLGGRVNNVAISFYDLTTKESFNINGDVLFKAASTHKVPLNLVLYDLILDGKINLNDKVEYIHSKHNEGGSGVLQNQVVNGYLPPQTFSELSRRSLLNSDNIAANMLITGINKYSNLYREYGNILGYSLNRTGNMFSTNEMMHFLRKLYYNEENNLHYKNIVTNLKNSSQGVRIGKYIPESIVANKYGAYGSNYHDIGIVYGDKPFIICIYTNNVQNAEKFIADIAKLAYER